MTVRQVVRRQFRKKKMLQKLYQTLNEWKTHPYLSVLKLPLLVGLQQKVSELVLSITLSFNNYFIKYFKLVYRKNVIMETVTTAIMFLLFTCMLFWVWTILRRWSVCSSTTHEVVCCCLKFEKHWSTETY
jgi:uncharacterized membrane protein YphA (DoxX/SURF4 family)